MIKKLLIAMAIIAILPGCDSKGTKIQPFDIQQLYGKTPEELAKIIGELDDLNHKEKSILVEGWQGWESAKFYFNNRRHLNYVVLMPKSSLDYANARQLMEEKYSIPVNSVTPKPARVGPRHHGINDVIDTVNFVIKNYENDQSGTHVDHIMVFFKIEWDE